MVLSNYSGMNDCNNANQHHIITPYVPPANYGIPKPPPSPDKSKMLPPPTPVSKGEEKEKDCCNVGNILMDLAKDGAGNGTGIPAEIDTSTILPAPTDTHAPQTQPACTAKETRMTPEKPTNPMQKGTPKPYQPATPNNESSSRNHNDTEDKDFVSFFLEWIGLDPNCKRMIDDEMTMSAHYLRNMGYKAVPNIQQAVDEDSKLIIDIWGNITAAMYAMHKAIVQFDTLLGNIFYFSTSQRKRKVDKEDGRGRRVHKECKSL